MSFLPANVSRFEFAVAGLDAELRVVRLSGREEMSQPFVYDIELACENDAIDFAQVVDHAAVLGMVRGDETRYVNGIISRFEQGEMGVRFALYHVQLVPKIWRLKYRQTCRIFQDKSAPQIIAQVLNELGLGGNEYRQVLNGQHPTREYCVQYRESEFNFISRLMEEEGIFYYFEHADDKHVLVMSDDSSVHPPVAGTAEITYAERHEGMVSEEHIFRFRYAEEIRPGTTTLRDYNFKKPSQDLEGVSQSNADKSLAFYDYPGIYDESAVGKSLAKTRLEELRVPSKTGTGESVCTHFMPGYTFKLTGFSRDALNQKYLLTALSTVGAQPQVLEESAGSGGSEFSNSFSCIPFTVPYRPTRRTPKPFVQGAQTAIVVGPAGEEIYTDEHGRIKVQFHWDREGQGNERSSCWIRTSQAWAGTGWGAVCIPRIGHEVIVDFLEGDPDRPIVTGRVYHGTNRTPYALPENKTRTALKSASSKGSDGFNEIRIEDKKGDEQIFIHAERNQDLRVKKDSLEWIGNDRHLIVKNEQVEKVEVNKHLLVKKDQVEKIEGDLHETIVGDRMQAIQGTQNLKVTGDRKEAVTGENNLKVTGNHNLETSQTLSQKAGMDIYSKGGMNVGIEGGMNVHLKGGMNVVVEAGVSLTIKVGGNYINLSPAGVAISGTMVMINSGGAAGSGAGCSPNAPASPASPNTPKEAKVADDDKGGKVAEAKRAEKPPTPVSYSAQATTLKRAAKDGTPFCKECEERRKRQAAAGSSSVPESPSASGPSPAPGSSSRE